MAIECDGPSLRDPEYAAKERALLARLEACPGRPLVLALGSSRTRLALRAGEMNVDCDGKPAVCFNFGIPGAGPAMQFICLRRLLQRGIHPRLVYVEVLPALFSTGDRRPMEDEMLDGSRLSAAELSWASRYLGDRSKVLRAWLVATCLPLRSYRRVLTARGPDADALYVGDACGWCPQLLDVDAVQRARLTELAVHQYEGALAQPDLATVKTRALVDLLCTCRRENVPVVLVLMPEGNSFRSLRTPRAADAFERFLTETADLFHVPLVDAQWWLDDEHFYDGHHTLPQGAALFTNRLAASLRQPLTVARAVDAHRTR